MHENGPTQLNIPRDFFYGDIECEIPQPMRIERGAGGEKSLQEAADLIAQAKNPVIVSGGGVVMSGAVDECIALAERLGAPVVNSYLHNDSFPASHPQWCGPLGYQGSKAAMRLISEADVVIALGTRLGPFGTLPQHGMDYWPKDAKIIQIDCNSRMLGLVKKISVGICGDAGAAAIALSRLLADKDLACDSTKDARLAHTAETKAAWELELDEWIHEKDDFSLDMIEEQAGEEGSYLHPRQVVFHNRQWGAEKKNQVDFYGRRFVAGELENQSFAGIGRAMGAEGVTVDKLEEVGPALKAAVERQMKEGKTTILEIMCTRELGDPFRKDALSTPVRHLEKYKDYV